MKNILFLIGLFSVIYCKGQSPKLYIQLVTHNEPSDNLQNPVNYAIGKQKILQMADIVVNHEAKWNLQSSDGFVFGARLDQQTTGTNVFSTLASAPYQTAIEIDPRNKNFNGRNIADQWYLLDSLGANPSYTVGGFIYYVCQPSNLLPDWFQYQDTITGLVHGNKLKLQLLSGAGSAGGNVMHCNDLYDFGIFKPDTIDRFYMHNPNRSLWCLGTGCAPVLDSLSDVQAIIDLIQGQADSIYAGLWPSDKFYMTRIMTNQREFGPLFFSKLEMLLDSLGSISNEKLEWATLGETFEAFQNWQVQTGMDYSQWSCGQYATSLEENNQEE
ncbi:MAG: hypothetical protein K1X82_15440, partial [Bacteroidia bacterium]|nr:hypothetical protein [Bacteroidia bacterium]